MEHYYSCSGEIALLDVGSTILKPFSLFHLNGSLTVDVRGAFMMFPAPPRVALLVGGCSSAALYANNELVRCERTISVGWAVLSALRLPAPPLCA